MICYSPTHYQWLCSAGHKAVRRRTRLGMGPFYARRDVRGTLLNEKDGLVRVAWENGEVLWHFPENVQEER